MYRTRSVAGTALLRSTGPCGRALGEADGVWITDGSDLPKQGEPSVGVARQWCGHVGKVEHCQAGVFAAYARRTGYPLLDRRLFCRKSGLTRRIASAGSGAGSP